VNLFSSASARLVTVALLAGLFAAACDSSAPSDGTAIEDTGQAQDPGDCTVVDTAVSSEKIDLMRDLAAEFNGGDGQTAGEGGGCAFVIVQSKPSGGAATLLAEGWNEAIDGPRPVIWSPASAVWGAVVNQRVAQRGGQVFVPDDPISFMATPLVIAMPEPMAQALGWPDTPIGWVDVLELARSDEGWAAFGHPEWGPFRLGKTNPNFSTSGLLALVAQNYAGTGKDAGLTLEDLAGAQVQSFARDVESAVVHYGPTTLTFLNNWYRNDQRGTALTYASAAAVEEISVVQYNRGNPDGVLDPGEQPRPPRVPLVAVYPKEGTLFSDNPLFVLADADWTDAAEAAAAESFVSFVQRPENQQRVLEFGFRPGNPQVAIGDPITTANGVDPTQPETTLPVPEPSVVVAMIDNWAQQRKPARVLVVLDVSGSMGEAVDDSSSKLDLAKRAASNALPQFEPQDSVGLWAFSSDLAPDAAHVEIVPVGLFEQVREQVLSGLSRLVPTNGTPLFTVTEEAYRYMLDTYDPEAINAIVVLTDGRNEDENNDLFGLLDLLSAGSEGASSRPVRVFAIGYGADADLTTLRQIAEATDSVAYDASDPATIDKVFTDVISNF